MAKKQPSYAQLVRDVVQAAPEPLTVAEIMERVTALRPITTKNPEQTIRNVLSDGAMLVNTGDGRYGWKTRVINGSLLRLTLRESDLLMEVLQWSDELFDALCPTFLAKQMHRDLSPAIVTLPDGVEVEFTYEFLYPVVRGTHATPHFWEWLESVNANAGDHLLLSVDDAAARRYSLTFQARRDRDEEAIAARNEAFVEMVEKLLNRPYGVAPWEATTHALARGMYKHPVPPDPLYEIVRQSYWHLGPRDEAPQAFETAPDPLLSALFERPAQVYDPENPPDLPREYDPSYGRRRPRPSAIAQSGSVTTYMVRVNHRALPEVWRDIELAEDQTFEDLHLQIQMAFGWYDDHLYSFYLSGEASDPSSEIGSPWSEARLHTHQVEIGQLDLKEGQTFLYLFDYGDSHEFDVTVRSVNPQAKPGKYPKVVDKQGESPPQYPEIDEETGEMSWDPYAHLGD